MTNEMFKKEAFKKSVKDNVKFLYRKTIEEATQEQIFQAVSYSVKDVIIDNWLATQKAYDEQDPKIVYYMSMEFLMGRALGNNLINLCAYGEVKEALEELGFDLNCIEDQEPDPALGNGGLGRLAACFLDSLATLNYAAYGCGIRYHYGMFKQKIQNGYQIEVPDNWLKNGYPFELRRPEYAKEVHFGGYVKVEYDPEKGGNKFIHEGYQAVKAVPYDMPITGYNNDVVNTLRIWDAEPIVDFELDSFDKGDYKKAVEQENLARNIVEVLYPNDNHYAGKELRLKQQYFFVSASLQAAIAKYKKKHDDIHKLYEKVTFQMNDTHPTVAVAELMRILMDEEGLGWDEAWEVTTKTCAYTNHTIMAEALEKWPIDLFSKLLPRVYQIVEEIDRRFVNKIREMYERCTKMPVGDRQPYVGKLVFTAFSGSHQDAINKGTQYMKESNSDFWEIPYLPIDPADVGREYEPIIRINSQSGKGGAAYIMDHNFGFNLPKEMHPEFGAIVQRETDAVGTEITPERINELFHQEYVDVKEPYKLLKHAFQESVDADGHSHVTFWGTLQHTDTIFKVSGDGNGPIDAFFNAIKGEKMARFSFLDYASHAITDGSDSQGVAYILLRDQRDGREYWGVGLSHNINLAPLRAILSAINRAKRK